jgi:hypothetical protein
MDDLDLIDVAVAAFVVLCIVTLAAAIFWPLDARDDVMQRVHGDQPMPTFSRDELERIARLAPGEYFERDRFPGGVALLPDAGSGRLSVLSGDAAARSTFNGRSGRVR